MSATLCWRPFSKSFEALSYEPASTSSVACCKASECWKPSVAQMKHLKTILRHAEKHPNTPALTRGFCRQCRLTKRGMQPRSSLNTLTAEAQKQKVERTCWHVMSFSEVYFLICTAINMWQLTRSHIHQASHRSHTSQSASRWKKQRRNLHRKVLWETNGKCSSSELEVVMSHLIQSVHMAQFNLCPCWT